MPQPGESWWDVCAGGGGKSLQLADMMQRRGTVYSTDIRAYKLEDLKRRAARAAFPNIRCAEWDGTRPTGSKAGLFDGVLVDAPCSSSGRWRRNPDGRWTTPLSRVEELTASSPGFSKMPRRAFAKAVFSSMQPVPSSNGRTKKSSSIFSPATPDSVWSLSAHRMERSAAECSARSP